MGSYPVQSHKQTKNMSKRPLISNYCNNHGDPVQSHKQTKNMSKRPLISNYCNNNNVKTLKPLLTKDKAEEMCQKKLRQVRRLKTNLYAMVLVRNTLKYVQSCKNDAVATDTVHNLGEYQPFNKKPCREISSNDIDKILDKISFSLQMPKRQLNWKESKFATQDDEALVPEIEIFEYQNEEEGFYSNNINMKLDSIWDLSIC